MPLNTELPNSFSRSFKPNYTISSRFFSYKTIYVYIITRYIQLQVKPFAHKIVSKITIYLRRLDYGTRKTSI